MCRQEIRFWVAGLNLLKYRQAIQWERQAIQNTRRGFHRKCIFSRPPTAHLKQNSLKVSELPRNIALLQANRSVVSGRLFSSSGI